MLFSQGSYKMLITAVNYE